MICYKTLPHGPPDIIKSKHLHRYARKFNFIWSKIHENEVLYRNFIKTVSRRRSRLLLRYCTFQLKRTANFVYFL